MLNLKTFFSKNGMSMVEVIIAMFLTMIVVVSVSSMIPLSWTTATRSDYLGKAAGLLQDELEWRQYQTMRGVDPTTLEYPPAGQAIVVGNTTFTVKTTTSPNAIHPNTWTVNVNVTWPGNDTGVFSSMSMTRQLGFNNLDNI